MKWMYILAVVLLSLTASNCCWAALTPTSTIPVESLTVSRNSIAYDKDFNQVAANIGRFEDIGIANRPELIVYSSSYASAAAIDNIHSAILFVYDYKLKKTTNGTDFEVVVDVRTSPVFTDYWVVGDAAVSVMVLPDGSWILSTGQITLDSQGHLFRSTDKGATWTHVLQFQKGFAFAAGTGGIADNEVIVTEYGEKDSVDNPRRVYYSDDYGAAWSVIYEPNVNNVQHGHSVAFAPGNTDIIYATYGDFAAGSVVVKLEYSPGPGGKANKDNWAKTKTIARFNSSIGLTDDTYLYFGHDEGSLDPIIWRLDPNDDLQHDVLRWPSYREGEPNHPYLYQSPRGDPFGMLLYDGVYYATVRDVYTQYNSGMYVSTDGEHWVRAYGVEGIPGFNRVFGYLNGYIWGSYRNATGSHLFKMRPIKASLVRAIRAERGITNALDSIDDSSFEVDIGNWGCWNKDTDPCEGYFGRSNQESLHGDYSLVWTAKDNGFGYAVIDSGYWNIKPSLNDYLCVSFWIKGSETWPLEYNYNSRAMINVYNISGSGAIDTESTYFQITKEWQKITIWGKCTDGNWAGEPLGPRLLILLYDNGWFTGDPNHDRQAQCYIDAVQVVYFPDQHYNSSWQIGGTVRDDESAYSPLAGLGSEFTITFEWQPESSSREWHDDIYIATVTDDTNYIDLYYDQSESKFVATDGTNTATTTGTFTWEHTDSLKFAMTNLNGDFRLSVQTSLKAIEHALTDNTATTLAIASGITFGTDSGETRFASGLFTDIKTWDTALTSTQIYGVFANGVTGDFDGDYDVDLKDFAVFAQRFLNSNCQQYNWCNGADFDENGTVDWSDLKTVLDNWLFGR